MDSTLYATAFSDSRSPPSTFHPISLRISLHRALTQDLASYLHERNLIEQDYVQSLERLSTRLHSSTKEGIFSNLDQLSHNDDPLELSLQLSPSLSKVKRSLENEVKELVRVHGEWTNKVHREVEEPIRDSLNKSQWTNWTRRENEFKGDIREYESLVDKISKAQSRSATKSKLSSSSSSKLLSTQSSLSSLGSTLTNSLPPFLSLSQSLESSQTQLLKELLTIYGTLSTDLAQGRMRLGERLVEKVLEVDQEGEMREWAEREGRKSIAGPRLPGATGRMGEFGEASPREREESREEEEQDAQSLAPSTNTTTRGGGGGGGQLLDPSYSTSTSNQNGSTRGYERERTSSRLSTAPPVAPLPLPTSVNDDSRSIRSSSNGNNDTTTPSKKKSKFGSKISSFLGGGGKDKDKGEKGEKTGTTTSRDRSSSIPNSARYSTFNNNSGGGGSTDQVPQLPTPSPATTPTLGSRDRQSSFTGGGGLFRRGSRMSSIPDTDPRSNYNNETITNGQGHGNGVPFVSEPEDETRRGGVDQEGFSVPPKGYDRAIGESTLTKTRNLMDDDEDEEDQRPLGESVPKLTILPTPVTSFSTTTPSSPSFSSSTNRSTSPVLHQESEEERLAALSAIKNSLGLPPSSSTVGGGLNRRATARARRSEASPLGVPAGGGVNNRHSMLPAVVPTNFERKDTDDDVPLATIQQESVRRKAPPPPSSGSSISPTTSSFPVIAAASTSSTPSTILPSSLNNPLRTQSILSTNSSLVPNNLIAGSGGGGIGSRGGGNLSKRPDPFQGSLSPGIRISIIEQLNVLMKGGEVQKVLVTGEIGLSYRPERGGEEEEEEEGPIRLKLEGYEEMEKTALNPTYLSSTTSGGGEFLVDRSALERNSSGTTVQILKYQLKPPTTTTIKDMVPFVVKPTWRCEPNLTRIIVVYSKNPNFLSNTSTSSSSESSPFDNNEDGGRVEFEDVVLEVPFQGTTTTDSTSTTTVPKIGSFQSKPPSIGSISRFDPNTLEFSLPHDHDYGGGTTGGEGEEKLLVSVQTEGGQTVKVGNMNLRWRVEGRNVGKSRVEVIGGRRGGVREVRREIESGKYLIA
ncbi:hypothetical protein JCM16303_002791 [Sporobolomyces ruberrimus]